MGCNERPARHFEGAEGIITDNDESRFKPISNFDGGGGGGGGSSGDIVIPVPGRKSSSAEVPAGIQTSAKIPVMRIVITNADEVERQQSHDKHQLQLEEEEDSKTNRKSVANESMIS